MPNYNPLILTGADYKLFLGIAGGGVYPLKTTDSIDLTTAVEEELIYAVGEEDAIGNKKNARKRSGKLSMQVGEINAILELEGLIDATFITGATLAATAIQGGFARTWKGVNINTEAIAVKGKDKQSLCAMDFTALSAL